MNLRQRQVHGQVRLLSPLVAALGGAIVSAFASLLGISLPTTDASNRPNGEILAIRSLGATAAALLTLVLCIGPLARLDRGFAALVSDRAHLGVATALIVILHGGLSNRSGVPPAFVGAPGGEPLDFYVDTESAGRPAHERFAESVGVLGTPRARPRSIQLLLADSVSWPAVSSESAVQ
jgi:hypothetical protein